ncbi:hypothetical protein ENKNEFLB_03283 [Nocardioides aquaticus]|uniref:DUF6752 domain-containing protein n=1 Tax=Nocardioides aquaticus TaxID=160826 RepID=A0ABX8EP11_9ACTN|nr:hypothetical protein ENKNEFLB_03283 [Nocardioides aquaticus]
MSVTPRGPWNRLGAARHAELEQRVADLEAEVSEMRRHNMRLAELTDVVQELLVPMAGRDEERIRQAIEQFNASI